MNNHIFFLLLIYTTTLLHSMEQNEANQQTLALPNITPICRALKNDYKIYLNSRLEEYKKTDVNMDELVAMSAIITGKKHSEFSSTSIHNVMDKEFNRFIHIAVQKADLPTVQWIYNNTPYNYTFFPTNKNGQSPLDLCIEQLSPDIIGEQKNTDRHKVLNATILYIGKTPNYILRYQSLQKIINLQLSHKKNKMDFTFEPELLYYLVPQEELAQKESYLSKIYQKSADEDGNTFTHLLVGQDLPDELFQWIKQEHVSSAKNNAGQSPLDLALIRFQCSFQPYTYIPVDYLKGDVFNKRRCCLLMLLNYFNNQQLTGLQNCCDKHIVVK